MPSDQNENLVGWQDADVMQSMQWARPGQSVVDADEQPPVQAPVDTDGLLELDPKTDNELSRWAKQPLISKDSLMSLGRQLSPILIPLPFALVVFGLTLPLTLRHSWLLSPLGTGILLLALAIVQGVLLAFAGSNDTLWMLYVTLGYVLLIMAGVLAALGPGVALLTLVVVLILGFYLARRAIHPTKEGNVELVEAFGRYSHTFYQGINLLLPWEKVSQSLNTQETVWTTPIQRLGIVREQDVQFTASISYQLLPEDAHLAAQTVREWEKALQQQFGGVVQSVVNDLKLSDFVAWAESNYPRAASEDEAFNPAAATRWDRINSALSRRMQDHVATWGVQVNWVHIQDLTILPNVSSIVPPIVDGNTTQIIKPEAPAKQASQESSPAVKAVEKPEPAKTTASPAAPVGKVPPVEQLKEFYNAVRQNLITDPVTIRTLAQRFEELANDPAQSKTIDFDADRAASTLRARAQKLQEIAQARRRASEDPSMSGTP